jgi:hypothetical protein
MNMALRLFDGVFIIPVLQVFWTFFAILGESGHLDSNHPLTTGRQATGAHNSLSRLQEGVFSSKSSRPTGPSISWGSFGKWTP